MAELRFPDIAGAVFSGYDIGNRMRMQRNAEQKQNRLSELAGQAYTAPREQQSELLSQMATVSPEAAQQQQQAFQSDEDRRNKTMANMARLLVAAPQQARAGLYRQMMPTLQQFGLDGLPPDYNEQTASTIDQAANAIAQAYGGVTGTADQQNFSAMTQGFTPDQIQEARMIQAGLKPRAGLPTIQDTGNGYYGIDRRTLQATPVMQGAQQPQSLGVGGLDLSGDYQQFASLGIPVTSTVRTPERNASVGGVPNSYHLTGEAIDIAPRNPQEKEQARQYWQSRGYQVIDEQDHLHVEPPGRGVTTSQLKSTPNPKGASELEQRIAAARAAGATEDEIKRMIIGREGAAAGAKPLPPAVLKLREETIAEAETAKTINSSLDRHIGLIRGGNLEFGPIQNIVSQGRNAAGQSNEQSRNYAEFRSDLEKLRNDSLRLNAGVQTDGDAQRAWNELFSNLGDTKYVLQRLETIRRLNDRAETLKRASVERIDSEYGRDSSGQMEGNQPSQSPSGWSIQKVG